MEGIGFRRGQTLGLGLMVLMVVWALCPSVLAQEMPPPSSDSDVMEESSDASQQYYSAYAEQAMMLYRKGESSKAIDLMKKAFQLAPNNTAVINNLAACYIQRGVYYQNTARDFQKALGDYRQALFYLVHEWPEDIGATTARNDNAKIIRSNMVNALKDLHVNPEDWNWHLKSAWALRRQGNLPEALVEFNWVTELNPRHADAWMAKGDIYTVRQKPGRATQAYQKAIELSTAPSADLRVRLGTAYLQNSTPDKAAEQFNQALILEPGNKDALLALEQLWQKEIVLNPRNMTAHLNLGAIYQQLQRYDDAYAQYQVADRLSPGNTVIKLNLGSLYQAQGKLDQALAMYDAVLQQNPRMGQAMLYKADILKKQGRAREAEQLLQQALQVSPDQKLVLEQLVTVAKNQGDPAKLKSAWDKYVGAYPQDADIAFKAGLAMHEIKAYDEARAYYQKAVSLKPDMAAAYANLGTVLHAQGQEDDALKALKKAISLDPSLENLNSLVATIEQQRGSQTLVTASQLHEAGRYTEAVAQYELALKQAPKNPDIHARYGLSLQALKRFPAAAAAYDKAIALDPENAVYYYYKGTVMDEQNQAASATALYRKALALDPGMKQAQDALTSLQSTMLDDQLNAALAAYNQKNYPRSLQLTEQILKSDPTNATAHYYRGLVLDAQQKPDMARQAYEKAVSADPMMSDAVYALAVVLDTQGKTVDAKKNYQQFLDMVQDKPEDDFIRYAKTRISQLSLP